VLAQFEPWDEDAAIAPGLDCVYAPGHTPGSAIFSITSGSERALILGDSVHCPQELMDPDFFGGGVDIAQADATRERIRRDAEDGATLLSAPHFPRLQFGRLRVGDRPRRWSFEWVPAG
jgi:glyoxylase-like metal-dependent hydrolase (beta-lactamase superfamily II)